MSQQPASSEDADQTARLKRALGDAYELKGVIGTGGFASVYAAFDRQLKRDVAIKVLRAELEAPVFRERFRREAESVAQLRHPHIVPIYAVGEAEGLAWLVMPLVRGESLQQRLAREGKLPIDDATRILADAASALATAHRAGIIHRDIKPDNIMLDGDEGHVLLMDFGIAKALGPTEGGITATGMIVGTPQYMSPEQASGERTIDSRSDIYALGVVGFQMIAGTPPFSAPSIPMLIMKQITEPAPPVTSLRRDCPAALEAIIARCLEKEPGKRFASADELVHALRGEPRSALAPGIHRLASRVSGAVAEEGVPGPIRRFRLAALIAVVLFALALVGDLALGRILVSPIVLLVSAFVLASMYGRLWTDGYDWHRVLHPEVPAPVSSGTSGSATPRSIEMKRLGPHGPLVHRARSDRGTIIAILAQLPRSERERMPDVLTVLDSLLAEATSLAAQITAAEGTPAGGSAGALTQQLERIRREPESPSRHQRMGLAEARARLASEREKRRERMTDRLQHCFSSIEEIRHAVERTDAEGWSVGEPLLTQALEMPTAHQPTASAS